MKLLGVVYGVDKGFGVGSDSTAEILLYWSTVSLAVGSDTARKAAIATGIGALRICKRAGLSAHALHIAFIELGLRFHASMFHALVNFETVRILFLPSHSKSKRYNGMKVREGP